MNEEQIRQIVKQVIQKVTSIKPEAIADDTRFRADLNLDSLTLLEIGISVDYEFKLGLAELDEKVQALDSVDDTVRFVQDRLAERAA